MDDNSTILFEILRVGTAYLPIWNARHCLRVKYEFASSNITRTTFTFDACFVWKLAPLAEERNGFFHRISNATIDALEHVFNVANSYLAC
jgi:hypothetical protein